VSWERVWLAVWVSEILTTTAEHVRARMVLEMTLETTTLPAHRALLLARLAQHAAGLGAPRLGKKWLRACTPLQSESIRCEKTLARALIALANGKHVEACALTGDRDPGAGFTALTAGLAMVIHMEAMERRGRLDDASDVFQRIAKYKLLDHVLPAITAYGLGRSTIARVTRLSGRAQIVQSALLTAAVVGFIGMIRATLLGTVLGALGAGAAQALLLTLARAIPWWRWFLQTWRQRMHIATLVIVTLACIIIAGRMMPKRERPYALVRAETSTPLESERIVHVPASSSIEGRRPEEPAESEGVWRIDDTPAARRDE
jgi:hypothetical protein